MSVKNPLTPAGIETATFRFVAQHRNHCATAVPRGLYILHKIPKISEESITHHIRNVTTCSPFIDVTKFCIFPTEIFLWFSEQTYVISQNRQSTYNEKLRGFPVHIVAVGNQ